MQKVELKSFIAGSVCTVLLFGMGIPAVAAVKGTLKQNQVNIIADGKIISNAGEDYALSGSTKVPSSVTFTTEGGGGTVYLPVRRLAELLGVDIAWDGSKNAVVVGENITPIEPENTPVPSSKDNVEVLGIEFEINSAGGVTPTVYWKNNSGKQIKYVDFYMVPYNKVNDPLSCEITGKSEKYMNVTGPIDPYNAPTQIEIPFEYYFWHYGKICDVSLEWTTVGDGSPSTWDDEEPTGRIYVKEDFLSDNKYFLTDQDRQNTFDQAWTSNDPMWYNYDVDHIDLTKISIVYMDGKTETINNPQMVSERSQ